MVVNDDAVSLIPLGALEFFASQLAPTGTVAAFCAGKKSPATE